MASLAELLAAHPTLLLLDSCSSRIQAGLWQAGRPHWAVSDDEAGRGLFAAVESLLAQTGLGLRDVGAFAFCEGPGSVLGIRTAAMALRTWQVLNPAPIHAFRSLEVVAHFLARPELTLIADARRDTWHAARLGQPLQRLPTAALAGPLAMPAGFRHWSSPPPGVERVGYDLAAMLPALAGADLFRRVDEPEAFLHVEPAYATWTPGIHRAPA